MDKTLKLKLKEYEDALKSLREVLEKDKNDIVRDSTIKRFEYSFELCWKTSKRLLSDVMGTDVYSPKECFRELRKNGLLTPEEAEKALFMTNDRNESVHNYNESFSDELYEKIIDEYASLLNNALNRLKERVE